MPLQQKAVLQDAAIDPLCIKSPFEKAQIDFVGQKVSFVVY